MNDDETVLIICKLNAGDPVTRRDWAHLLKHFRKKNPHLKLPLLKSLLREQGIPVPKGGRQQ